MQIIIISKGLSLASLFADSNYLQMSLVRIT